MRRFSAALLLLLTFPLHAQTEAPRPPRNKGRPTTVAELQDRVAELTAAEDFDALWSLCRDLGPRSFPKEPVAMVFVELCRGRALQALGEREKARASYEQVVRLASGMSGAELAVAQQASSEARYRIGEVLEASYEAYPLCVRELGIFWGSRAEADEKTSRFKDAERAYQDAVPLARRPWPQRAAFRRAALHMAFYRDVAGRSAPTFRGLQGPPPLPAARVEVANDALRLMIDPQHASWPLALKDVAELAHRRAKEEGDDPELMAAADALVAEARSLTEAPRAPMTSPFPPRKGNERGWKSIAVDGEQVVFEEAGGSLRREVLLKVGPTLVEVLKGGLAERFAPDAAVVLGLGGYRAAVPALVEAALGDDEETAVAAVFALGELGTGAQLPTLYAAYAKATPPGESPAPFESPAMAIFGMRERVLEALSKIARREPLSMLNLHRGNQVPRREAAFVLWQAARKEFRPIYAELTRDGDDMTAMYGVLGLATLSPGEARNAALGLKNRKQAGCWAEHLEGFLRPRTSRR